MIKQLVCGFAVLGEEVWVGLSIAFGCLLPLVSLRFLSARKQPAASSSDAADLAERRAWERQSVTLQVFVSGDKPEEATGFVGWVLDRAPGGVCLTIGKAVWPGTTLQLRSSKAGEQETWILVDVRNCRLDNGCWKLGCQYREPPNLTAEEALLGPIERGSL